MAVTVQMQFESVVTEMYEDAFIGSSIENGTTIIQFDLRKLDFQLPIRSINFHYSAFQAVDTETVSSLVHTGSPAATPIRASANAGFPPP